MAEIATFVLQLCYLASRLHHLRGCATLNMRANVLKVWGMHPQVDNGLK